MTVIERDENWTGDICDGPDCPHYGKRAKMVCFDKGHWKSIPLVRAEQLEGAVSLLEQAVSLFAQPSITSAARERWQGAVDELLGDGTTVEGQSAPPAATSYTVTTTRRDGTVIAEHEAASVDAAHLDILTDGLPSTMELSIRELVDLLGRITDDGGEIELPNGDTITVTRGAPPRVGKLTVQLQALRDLVGGYDADRA